MKVHVYYCSITLIFLHKVKKLNVDFNNVLYINVHFIAFLVVLRNKKEYNSTYGGF